MGLSATRNFGLERCVEYVMFLDSDDKWEVPQSIQQLIDIISGDSKHGFLQFNVKSFYDNQEATDFRIICESKYYYERQDILMLFPA